MTAQAHRLEPCVLHSCPPVLSLPSADPAGLIVEAWLRACGAPFHRVHADHDNLRLVIPASPQGDSASLLHHTQGGQGKNASVGITSLPLILDAITNSVPAAANGGANAGPSLSTSLPHAAKPRAGGALLLNAELMDDVQVSVRQLVEKCLIPAFTYLLYLDPSTYYWEVRSAVDEEIVRSRAWMQRLFSLDLSRESYRRHVLRQNLYALSGTRLSSAAAEIHSHEEILEKVHQVQRDVMEACRTLNTFCRRRHQQRSAVTSSSSSGDGGGGSAPLTPIISSGSGSGGETLSVFDAYVYGAISCFIHADFEELRERYRSCHHHPSSSSSSYAHFKGTAKSPSPHIYLESLQKRIREQCPSLVQYVEQLREVLFQDKATVYLLHPLPDPVPERPPEVDIFAKGRAKTLFWTAAFGLAYFFLTNIGLAIQALEGDDEEGDEGDEGDE